MLRFCSEALTVLGWLHLVSLIITGDLICLPWAMLSFGAAVMLLGVIEREREREGEETTDTETETT